jgi:triphosphoribosyl-dephospho-CoA synthase
MHELMNAFDTFNVFDACVDPRRAPAEQSRRQKQDLAFCAGIGRLAVRSLYAELTLYPKPGLVSLIDSGSHDDMTAATFMRSLFALRHYFIRITGAGLQGASFSILKHLGIEAEQRMLRATSGVNTHRGAIFCLGLLCAAIGSCHAQRIPLSASGIRAELLIRWSAALAGHARPDITDSHGLRAASVYSVGGAREEAAHGLPSLFDVALPTLQRALADGRGWRRARIDALFALMAHISDTNVYHRGGKEGARMVRQHAQDFLVRGGTGHPDWESTAMKCHRLFVDNKLSPGGAADLLSAACFMHEAVRHI